MATETIDQMSPHAIFMDENPHLDVETVKEIFDLIEDKCPPGRVYSKINGVWQYEWVGRERTIEEVLQNCAKLRGVHGLSWRTLHDFFWFVSASKWGNRECYTEEEHRVYRNFNGRPIGLNVSFDKMLLDEALLFEEYCENEYRDDEDATKD